VQPDRQPERNVEPTFLDQRITEALADKLPASSSKPPTVTASPLADDRSRLPRTYKPVVIPRMPTLKRCGCVRATSTSHGPYSRREAEAGSTSN